MPGKGYHLEHREISRCFHHDLPVLSLRRLKQESKRYYYEYQIMSISFWLGLSQFVVRSVVVDRARCFVLNIQYCLELVASVMSARSLERGNCAPLDLKLQTLAPVRSLQKC